MNSKRTPRDPSKALQVFDELLAEELFADVTTAELTDADRQWVRTRNAEMHARIAAMRRRHTPVNPPIIPAGPLPEAIARLSRTEVLAQLETWTECAGARYASMDFAKVTDDDLRHLLAALIEADAE